MSEKITIRIGSRRKTFNSIQEVAKAFKIDYSTLYQRLFIMKWPAAKAVKTKIRKKKANRKKKRV